MGSKYLEYQLTGKPTWYVDQVAHDIDEDDRFWREKAERLQARRWKKILRSG